MRVASGTSSSTMRPTRTSFTPSNPRAGSARSTVCPCGSRIPCLGLIRTLAFMKPCKSSPAGVLVSRRIPILPRPCVLGWLDFRASPATPPQPLVERLAGDALVRVHVELARASDHVLGQLGCRRRLVPTRARGPVAHVLLVEARLTVAGLVAVRRPEARRVGREHLVAEDDRAVGAAAELELGVGEDDPALARMVGGRGVDREREAAELLE